MAVSISTLTSGSDVTGVTSTSTASISPTANNLVLATVVSRTNASVQPNAPTLTGNGLTWVQVATLYWDTDSTSRKLITLFRAMGASPSTGAVTIDFAGQTQTDILWIIDQGSGINTSGTNGSGAVVQSATNKDETQGTPLSITLAAFGSASNGTYGVFTNDVAPGSFSVGSGFTKLADLAAGTALYGGSEWRSDNATTVNCTMSSGAGAKIGGIAIEIAVASVAGTTAQRMRMGLG